MSKSRNPTRTRDFYENLMAEEIPKPIMGPPNQNVTASASSGAKVGVETPDHGLSTSIPSVRPSVNVPKTETKHMPPPTTTAKTTTSTNTPPTEPHLIGMINSVWDEVRGIFGGKKLNCVNGGKSKSDGSCDCPKFYNGTQCEKKQCLNGGTLQKVTSGQISYECQCPNPMYMEGAHCEKIRCANDAILHIEPNGTWHCDCSQKMFYKGVFCEKFSPPMGIAIPLVIALIFLLCCGLCRIDWCPRKRTDRRREGRSSRSQGGQTRRRTTSRNMERARVSQPVRQNPAQEFLLSGERALCTRNPVAFPSHGNPYIIRLDTIPTFNPNMIGGVDPSAVGSSTAKPIEPPPSYEQAVQAPPMPDPPKYTERPEGPPILQRIQQPPPPNREAPLPPT